MEYFAGLDVSVKETSVCIVDDAGRIVPEARVASEPEALLAVLNNPSYRFRRIGLEAGPLSQWLYSALGRSELAGNLCRDPAHAGGSEGADQAGFSAAGARRAGRRSDAVGAKALAGINWRLMTNPSAV